MDYGFLLAHGYSIKKGYINNQPNEETAIKNILNGDYDDIIDEYDVDEGTEKREVIDIWEVE